MPLRVNKAAARVLQLNLDGDAEDVSGKHRNRQREEKMQRLLFAHRNALLPKYPLLRYLFATWNGVKLPPQTVKKLAGLGLKGSKGIFDLWLPCLKWYEDGSFRCGLAIDLKEWEDGRLSKDQKAWKEHLEANRWEAHCEESAVAAWRRIADYLGIEGEDYEAEELVKQEKWLRLEEG